MDAFWDKLLKALIAALIPILLKKLEEWLGGLSDDEIAKIITDGITSNIA